MLDVEANNEMHGWLPGIGTVLVLSGVVFVALGFVATSAYYNVMGFPAALFPPDSAMLGLMGFLYGAPAIFIVLLIPLTGLSGWIAGRTPWFRRAIADEAKRSRAIQSAMYIIAVLVATTSLVTRTTTTGTLHIPHSTEIR